jgi:hypothetical protein
VVILGKSGSKRMAESGPGKKKALHNSPEQLRGATVLLSFPSAKTDGKYHQKVSVADELKISVWRRDVFIGLSPACRTGN